MSLDNRYNLHHTQKKLVRDWLIVLAVIVSLVYLFTPPTIPKSPLASTPVVYAVEPSPEPIVEAHKPSVDDIVDIIWALESSRGKAGIGLQKYCEDRGGWNELGWGGMKGVNGKKICFKNKEEGFNRVITRINNLHAKYKNIGTTLCVYNLGKEVDDCKYYQDYLSLSESK